MPIQGLSRFPAGTCDQVGCKGPEYPSQKEPALQVTKESTTPTLCVNNSDICRVRLEGSSTATTRSSLACCAHEVPGTLATGNRGFSQPAPTLFTAKDGAVSLYFPRGGLGLLIRMPCGKVLTKRSLEAVRPARSSSGSQTPPLTPGHHQDP